MQQQDSEVLPTALACSDILPCLDSFSTAPGDLRHLVFSAGKSAAAASEAVQAAHSELGAV